MPTDPNSPTRPIPLRDFFRNPDQASFRISPDGEYISYTAPYERRMNVFVEKRSEFGKGNAVRVTSETDRDITAHGWKNDTIIFTRDFDGDENFHLFAANKDGSNTRDLTPFPNVQVNIIDELEEIDNQVLVGMNKRNPELFDVYRIDVSTGEIRLAAENPGGVTSWLADHTGAIRVAMRFDGVQTTYLYRDSESEDFRDVLTVDFREMMQPVLFTFDNRMLYAASNIGRDRLAAVIYDIANAREVETIFEHAEVDIDDIHFSKHRKVLTSIDYVTWKKERECLDESTRTLFERLAAKLPGRELILVDHSRNEQIFIVNSYSDRSRGTSYLYDFGEDRLEKLADICPWLAEEDLAPMRPISFSSRDGLTLHGYLTLPLDSTPKKLPVIIHPHGGPFGIRDVWTYNPAIQFLANRGYAVLQINFRGSGGYGRKFFEAGFKQWGRKMQDDVSDGVLWLIKEGIADPARVGIYGGSYGGYATLAGLTFTPELYACGIDYVGVSNMFTFMNTIPPYWEPGRKMMYEMIGDPERDKEQFEATSPIFHIDKIRAPLFVIQGAKDPRVNINESNQIVEALRARGFDVPYLVKENEGHGFHNEENRFEVYEAMEDFLQKHLGEK